ncbi:MAG: YdiU family protein [Sphingomicrobium sp.]
MPVSQAYHPDPRMFELGSEFYDPVAAAAFPRHVERFFNESWAERIGLNTLTVEERTAHFGRFEALPDNLQQPLALRYHGHQFRHYNPELGDGRGFLFAQLRDDQGRLLDLATKGSGQTPWSRRADGRLTLKGGVREVLATEMLEALGVNSSKSFALYETGEELWRGDEPSPTRSAVLTRLGHGHIRIGSFQRLAYLGDTDSLAALVRYCLVNLYAEPASDDPLDNAARLFDRVVSATASLAASYLAAGFVHGVLNSDNIAISGESFDYGPWRFTPEWDDMFTAAYFDETRLYSFGRQPEAIHWDVAQLAGCLALLGEVRGLADTLSAWRDRFQAALVAALLARLGIAPHGAAEDRSLAAALIKALRSRAATIDRLFFDWRGGRDPRGGIYASDPFRELAAQLEGRAVPVSHSYWSDPAPCSMHIDEVEAIWSPIAKVDDWSAFKAKIASIRRMGDAMSSDRPA